MHVPQQDATTLLDEPALIRAWREKDEDGTPLVCVYASVCVARTDRLYRPVEVALGQGAVLRSTELVPDSSMVFLLARLDVYEVEVRCPIAA